LFSAAGSKIASPDNPGSLQSYSVQAQARTADAPALSLCCATLNLLLPDLRKADAQARQQTQCGVGARPMSKVSGNALGSDSRLS